MNSGAAKKEYHKNGNTAAGKIVVWTNGYEAYENTVQHSAVVHEWSWEKSGYSSYWYAYAKSVKFDKTKSDGDWIYKFGDANYLGSSSFNGAWRVP